MPTAMFGERSRYSVVLFPFCTEIASGSFNRCNPNSAWWAGLFDCVDLTFGGRPRKDVWRRSHSPQRIATSLDPFKGRSIQSKKNEAPQSEPYSISVTLSRRSSKQKRTEENSDPLNYRLKLNSRHVPIAVLMRENSASTSGLGVSAVST